MDENKQRRIIAEACGWSRMSMHVNIRSGKSLWTSGGELLCGTPPKDKGKPEDEQAFEPVPDYLNDLNAMNEAENTLRIGSDRLNDILGTYRDYLCKIIGCAWYQSKEIITATAAQRAEAFIRTLGLWEND